jgi:uncharacterized protein
MDRLEMVRQAVDAILRQQPDEEERRCGFIHLYGVAGLCALLAIRRGLDPQLCAVAGMLHDISSYRTGDPTDHARLSAIEAESIIRKSGDFAEDEITLVCEAISHHDVKDEVDGDMAELLKDADVLQHHLYNPALTDKRKVNARLCRLRGILEELAPDKSDTNDNIPATGK